MSNLLRVFVAIYALIWVSAFSAPAFAHDHHDHSSENLARAESAALDNLQALERCQSISTEEFARPLREGREAYLVRFEHSQTSLFNRTHERLNQIFTSTGVALKSICLSPIQTVKFLRNKIADAHALWGRTFIIIGVNEGFIEPLGAVVGAWIGGPEGAALIAAAPTHTFDFIYYPVMFGLPRIMAHLKRWGRAGGPNSLFQLLIEQQEALGLVGRSTVAAVPIETEEGTKLLTVVKEPALVSKLPRWLQVAFAPEWLAVKESTGALSTGELLYILEDNSIDTSILKKEGSLASGKASEVLDKILQLPYAREHLERTVGSLEPQSRTAFAKTDLFQRGDHTAWVGATSTTELLTLLLAQANTAEERALLMERVDISARRLLIHFDLRLRQLEAKLRKGDNPERPTLVAIRKSREALKTEAKHTLSWIATRRFDTPDWQPKLGLVWTSLWRQARQIDALLSLAESTWPLHHCQHAIDGTD